MSVNHRLVLGVDGAGKSTLLRGLHEHEGTTVFEPSSCSEVTAFKTRSRNQEVTPELIDEREAIFLRLNQSFEACVAQMLNTCSSITTTGGSLVTRVSHSLMREVVTGEEGQVDVAVDLWLNDTKAPKPDQIVLIHAPSNVIAERLRNRADQGCPEEIPWGFNSVYFLTHYQATWNRLMDGVLWDAGIECLPMDSSQLSPREMLADLGV